MGMRISLLLPLLVMALAVSFLFYDMPGVALLSCLLLASTLLLIEFRVWRPLRQLAQAVNGLVAGAADAPLPAAGNDQVGALVRDFANLRATLRERENALREAQDLLEEQVNGRTEELECANRALYQEVHDRRGAETSLRNTLAQLKLEQFALDQHAIVAITDRGGCITYVNDKFCEISGYQREELLGQDHRIIGSGVHPRAFFREMWRHIGRGQVWQGEICNRSKQGGLYWVDTTVVPFLDGNNKPYQYVSIRTDVTRLKMLENQQESRHLRLRAQQHALLDLACFPALVDGELETAVRYITEVAARTLDCARVSLWWFDSRHSLLRCDDLYLPEEDRHEQGATLAATACPDYFVSLASHRVIAAADAATDPRTAEFGTDYLQMHDIGAMLDAPVRIEGNSIGVLCHEHRGGTREWHADEEQFAASLADMAVQALHNARRREAECALRLSELRFKGIAESLSDWIWETDPEGRYSWCSPGVEHVLGYSPEELLGQSAAEFELPEQPQRLGDLEIWHQHRDGRPICLLINGIPLIDATGLLLGYSGVAVDITARKEAEQALTGARDTALEALRLKTEFLANVSHEVRTPLHGILGLLGLLRGARLAAREQEYVEMACRAGESLLTLINNILDFSRLESQGLSAEEVPFLPKAVADEALQLHTGSARAKGLELRLEIPDDCSDVLRLGDPMRLGQVLGNLISNAIKFTAVGRIVVTMEETESQVLRFSVRDTGMGVAPEQRTRIFEAFVQGDGSHTRLHEGSGLGLAISRHIIEQMGGRMGVDPGPDQGSIFWFSVPLPRLPASVAATS